LHFGRLGKAVVVASALPPGELTFAARESLGIRLKDMAD